MIQAFVTIGTDDAWAPPRKVAIDLTEDFFITNINKTSWRIEAKGEITRAAILIRGFWCKIDMPGRLRVESGQDAVFAAGALNISVDLPLMDLSIRRDRELMFGKYMELNR